MKKDYNKTVNADLMSLDINKLVSDINEQKNADKAEENSASVVVSTPEDIQEGNEVGVTGEDAPKDTPTSGTETPPEPSPAIAESGSLETAATEQEDNELWKSFLENLKETGSFAKKDERKSYWIDDDIVNTLKSIDINRMSVSDIINAVLRTFITQEKGCLRKFVKKREVLI